VVVARDYFEAGRDTGHLAVRVMRGEAPASIPFAPIRTSKVIVNLAAAKACGLTIPPAVLRRAHEVIKE
jgi:putative ABC transport system substrate-binding protein